MRISCQNEKLCILGRFESLQRKKWLPRLRIPRHLMATLARQSFESVISVDSWKMEGNAAWISRAFMHLKALCMPETPFPDDYHANVSTHHLLLPRPQLRSAQFGLSMN